MHLKAFLHIFIKATISLMEKQSRQCFISLLKWHENNVLFFLLFTLRYLTLTNWVTTVVILASHPHSTSFPRCKSLLISFSLPLQQHPSPAPHSVQRSVIITVSLLCLFSLTLLPLYGLCTLPLNGELQMKPLQQMHLLFLHFQHLPLEIKTFYSCFLHTPFFCWALQCI